MAYKCKILADSLNVATGNRLTTFEITYPRFVHSELMTHRVFSRNSASSRAIPVARMIKDVSEDPVFPVFFGKNQPGMQAAEEMTPKEIEVFKKVWLKARDSAIDSVRKLVGDGEITENGDWWEGPFYESNVEHLTLTTHKQIANRILEPWMWITVIVSATEYDNWDALRCHPEAQPEIKKIAEMMREARLNNTPNPLRVGEWHMPLLQPDDDIPSLDFMDWVKIVTGRCARVSYLTHDGRRDVEADLTLHDRLLKSGHMSPFEHPAMAVDNDGWYGNFRGFKPYRKFIFNEDRKDLIDATSQTN